MPEPGAEPLFPTHQSVDPGDPDEDGWFVPRCSCGWQWGPCPDIETLVDVLMEHAAAAEAQK